MSQPADGRRRTTTGGVSRRNVARGAAWSAPVILIGASAPALAASVRDIRVTATACTDASSTLNNINFAVTTVGGATIPAGTVFTVQYAGGSTRPTWSGALATNSSVVITPGNDTSTNGGRYGTIRFTLTNPMPANTTWGLTITMDIGAFITGQTTWLQLTSSLPGQNYVTTNDSAGHEMYFGGCGT